MRLMARLNSPHELREESPDGGFREVLSFRTLFIDKLPEIAAVAELEGRDCVNVPFPPMLDALTSMQIHITPAW
jgi:hypothetical protein